MKKRILTLLLAGVMVFSSASEGISAAAMNNSMASLAQSTESGELPAENDAKADDAKADDTKTKDTERESTETVIPEDSGTEADTETLDTEENTEEDTAENTEEDTAKTAENTREATEEDTEDVDAQEMADKCGGLERPVNIEVDWENTSDVFEAEIDNTGSAAYNSEWDCYSSNYYYNMMNDDQRALWDQLDAMCLGYLTGNTTLTIKPKDGSGNSLPCYMTQYVSYSNLSKMQASETMQIFKYSNPQYYFLHIYSSAISDMSGKSGRVALTVYDAFREGGARAAATAQFKAVIDSWIPQINAQPNDLLKEKKAHDMICEKVIYDPGVKADPEYSNPAILKNEYNQVAYSVFLTDSTVCAGYSQAMQLLCNAVGIECAVVTSDLHEWNTVRLNDSWYYVDCTWNDDRSGSYVYQYFNRSMNYFLNNQYDAGTPNVIYHTVENFWNAYLPPLTYDSNASYDRSSYGTIFAPGSTMAAPVISISNQMVNISSPSGGTVYYTTDGRIPSASKTKAKRYTGSFAVPVSGNVKAVAVADGYWDSSMAEVSTTVYTVTFNSNGGSSVVSKVAENGAVASKPLDPTRGGYTFSGWYADASFKNAYNFANPVNGDIIIYAKWTPKKFTVTLNANGGYIGRKSVKTKKKTVTFDKTYGSLTSPKRGSYVFTGWYTKKSGGSRITSSGKVAITGNKTYYARWSKVKTKKASISKLKSSSSGKMTVKIKNISTASGYQIKYSQKSNMSSAKTKDASSVDKTISSLKKGKKYYVQVRMYQKESESGKKHYGNWSSIKTINIKK